MGTHTTYLDTVGRPKLTFHYKNLTPKHSEYILVSSIIPLAKLLVIHKIFAFRYHIGLHGRLISGRLLRLG